MCPAAFQNCCGPVTVLCLFPPPPFKWDYLSQLSYPIFLLYIRYVGQKVVFVGHRSLDVEEPQQRAALQ